MTKEKEASPKGNTPTNTGAKIIQFPHISSPTPKKILQALGQAGSIIYGTPKINIVEEITQDLTIDEGRICYDGLPTEVQEIVHQVAAENGACTNYALASILTIYGAAIGNTLEVRRRGYKWRNKANLYTILVGLPSAKKSPVIDDAIGFFKAQDNEMAEAQRRQYKEWKESGGKGEKPPISSCLLAEPTPEALSNRLAYNRRGMLIVADEYARFSAHFTAYNKTSPLSNLCSIWDYKFTKIDLKSDETSVLINDAFLGILAGVQPRLLPKLFQGGLDGGFPQRIIFIYPNNKLPLMPEREDLTRLWERMQSEAFSRREKTTLYFSPEADEIADNFQKFIDKTSDQLPPEYSIFGEWLSKQNYHLYRLSGIVRIMANSVYTSSSKSGEITVSDVLTAIRLIADLGGHWLRFLDDVQPQEKLRKRGRGEVVREFMNVFGLNAERKGFLTDMVSITGIDKSNMYNYISGKK